MKKIGIITIIDNNNYGNRLQNYALQEYLKKMNCHVVTLKNDKYFNHKVNITKQINFLLRYFKNKIKSSFEIKKGRKENFKEFNKHIVFNKKLITTHNQEINQEYDYFIVGSDQVWKPNYLRLSDIDLLAFADNDKRISYAASFGVNKVSKEYENKIKKEIPKFKKISVREEEGKHIIELLTKREDVEVLIDPTMLLTDKEWDKVMQKPKKVPDKK